METIKELVYDLMNGSISPEENPGWDSGVVENEFAEGKPCERYYRAVFEANQRICSRLGVEEDRDVECIISSMLEIVRIQAFRMFDYGILYGQDRRNDSILLGKRVPAAADHSE